MNQGIEVIMLYMTINENTAKQFADELHLTSFIALSAEDKLKIKDYKTKVKLWPWQET
jgi:hypothetical protein